MPQIGIAGRGGATVSVDDTAYDATSWNGDTTHAPSKNAVRDKIEALVVGAGISLEDVDDRVATLLIAGTNITLTYADNGAGAGTLTIDAAGPLTTEQVQDIVGALLADSGVIDVTYDDAGNTWTATVIAGSITNAMLAGSIALSKLATDPLARANHTGTQTAATISDFTEAAQDAVAASLVAGTNITITYNDAANTITITATGGAGSVATDTIWDAAGDLAVGTGADTAAKLAKGSPLQVLRVNAGATALEWAAAAGAVATDAIFDAKGDLAVGTGADTSAKLTVGSNGQRPVADSSQATGIAWTEAARTAVVASDVTHTPSNTTLSDVTGLLVPVSASATEIWFFELFLRLSSNSTAQEMKLGWTIPAGVTMLWGVISPGGSTTIAGFGAVASGADPANGLVQTDVPAYGLGASAFPMAWAGWIMGGGNAGNVQLQFAQNVSTAANLIAKAGSMLRFTKLIA